MTRSDLVARISAIYPYMSVKNVDRVISIVMNTMVNQLKSGGRIELRDFGVFSVRDRKQIEGRNPKSGEKVVIQAKKVPFFKAGKRLKDLINGRDLPKRKK